MPFDPDKYMKERGISANDSNLGAAAEAADPGPFIRGTGEFFGALPQGVLGIPEAIYQGAEKLGAPRVPEAIRAPLRRYRDWAESSTAGTAGETVGNIGAFIGGGELLDLLGLGGKLLPEGVRAWGAAHPGTTTLARTAGESAISQPVSGDRFWLEKGEQIGLGALLGRILGRTAQQTAHNTAAETNKAIELANKSSAEGNKLFEQSLAERNATGEAAVTQANKENERAVAQANKDFEASLKRKNDLAAKAAEAPNKANEAAVEQANRDFDAALKRKNALAAKATEQANKADQTAAARELSRRQGEALQERQAQSTAKGAVPQQATAGWWQRTGTRIGENVPADATADTGARVQARVGQRLNDITNRMTLDPADASFTEQIAEIRRNTRSQLAEHNQSRFYDEPAPHPLEPFFVTSTNEAPIPRTQLPAPKQPSGMWADQVLDPLKKGPLSGRQLTEYISRLGNEANTLATRARAAAPGSPEYADLLAQANALRQVQDTVIGHAAGSSEDKLALEQARQAYLMWGVGNDAAKASRGGVATPAQLIDRMVKRLGEARYKQALVDPSNPYHDDVNWLQQQQAAHAVQIPSAATVRAGVPEPPPPTPREFTPERRQTPPMVPTPQPLPTPERATPMAATPRSYTPERRRTPPLDPERPKVPVPKEPLRIGRIPRALGKSAGAAAAYFLGHPFIATGLGTSAAENLVRSGSEGRLEAMLREILENRPRTQRAARAVAGSTAGQADKLRKRAGDIPQAASDALSWAWGSR